MGSRFHPRWQKSWLGSWWMKIKQHPVVAILMCVGSVLGIALIVVLILGYWMTWHWTGLVPETSEPKQHAKTLWDWLQLLIIPVVLAVGGFLLSQVQKTTEQRNTRDNQQEAALQAYIDKISELLLKEHLGERTADGGLDPQYKHVRNVARVRTITVLNQLDARRVAYVFAFLREAGLMSQTYDDNVVSLVNADLRAVNWSQADLYNANLFNADLSNANLSRAKLILANLIEANLSNANLSGANLSYTNLSFADFRGANLSGANLVQADLSGAILKGATGITTEELEKQAKSLERATMPDGSKHS